MDLLNENDVRWSELFYFIKRKLWIIILACIVSAAIGFLVGTFILVPGYTATTKMYILNREPGEDVAYEDLQIGIHLTRDYAVLVTGENVTKPVIEKLNLALTPEELAAQMEVTVTENTRILEVAVTNPDPEVAAQIANLVYQEASQQIIDIMEVDAVNLVHPAAVPTAPSTPTPTRYMIVGALLGLLACVGILVLIYFLTDTLRNEDDVEFYLGLSTLALIPYSAELNAGQSRKVNS